MERHWPRRVPQKDGQLALLFAAESPVSVSTGFVIGCPTCEWVVWKDLRECW